MINKKYNISQVKTLNYGMTSNNQSSAISVVIVKKHNISWCSLKSWHIPSNQQGRGQAYLGALEEWVSYIFYEYYLMKTDM